MADNDVEEVGMIGRSFDNLKNILRTEIIRASLELSGDFLIMKGEIFMKKLYDLAVKAGSYSTKDGNEKAIWLNIGAVWNGNDDTEFMLLKAWFNPSAIERKNGSDCINVAMFEPRDDRNGRQEGRSDDVNKDDEAYKNAGNGESIPF